MKYIASTLQMKQIDEYLITKNGYTILELINIAANKLFEEVKDFNYPLILCGPGNNGADGLALAKMFKAQHKSVDIKMFYLDKANNQIKALLDKNDIKKIDFNKYDVIIDGIFGNGLIRSIDNELKQFINEVNQLSTYRISIDTPTNISGDLGIFENIAFKADKTITFMCYKYAMLNPDLKPYFGKIVLKEFGIEKEAIDQLNITQLVTEKEIKKILKPRHYDDYKGTYGTVLHLTGSKNYTGASCLAAKASAYSGSGIVKVCSDEEVLKTISFHLEEAVLETLDIDKLDLNKYQAVLFGCGKGWNEETKKLLEKIIEQCRVPLVIDADGLNVLSEDIEILKQAKCPIVLTPHIGELKRLTNPSGKLKQAAIDLAKKYNLVCLVKGPNTFITDGTHHYCNTTGNPAMASAGMGDVLAGMITSFLGQGYSLMDATILGVYIHGKCADTLAKERYTVLAHQLVEQIPFEMKKIM